MVFILVGATVLIVAVMTIRFLTKGQISMKLRYGLWLMVALRLMLPVRFGANPYSAVSILRKAAEPFVLAQEAGRPEASGAEGAGTEDVAASGGISAEAGQDLRMPGGMGAQGNLAGNAEAEEIGGIGNEKLVGYLPEESVWAAKLKETIWGSDVSGVVHGFLIVWILGMIGVGGYMFMVQIRFIRYLCRTRKPVPQQELPRQWAVRTAARRMRVYQVERLPVPCVVGRSIYLTPRLLEEHSRLSHVLAHEYAHVIQGDSLWALVRCGLCAVYWFYPPVWMAAYRAKQDSEFACDERAVRMLGEKQRFAYGRTLLECVSGGHSRFGYEGVVLSMDGSGRSVKERVTMIAGKRKNSKVVVALVMLAATLACGCVFTGAAENSIGEEKSRKREETAQVKPEEAEKIEQREIEMVQRRMETVEKENNQIMESEFEEMINTMGDETLDAAQRIEFAAYYDYLYEGEECPLKDRAWYLLGGDEEADISFYGLYTQQFGLRGMKMKVRDDVNTFDMPWIPSFQDIRVQVLEWAQDGAPRSFAFQTLVQNDDTHEIWQLYIADRYDTGTVDLSCFEPEDYIRQFGDMVKLQVNKEAQTVELVCGEDIVDSIDISRYGSYTVEEAVWEAAAVNFLPNAYSGREDYEPVAMMTGIGLKVAETENVQYNGLTNIVCPVDIGSWGERRFTLGTPYVAQDSFHGGADVLHTLDIE